MPPQPKVTQEEIRNAAFNLAGEGGIEAVNARGIAKRLGCSTQPLFRVYPSMSALMDDLYTYIRTYYDWFVGEYSDPATPFSSLGRAHLSFARKEPHLYRMLFLSEDVHATRPLDMVTGPVMEAKLPALAEATGLSLGDAQSLYLEAGLFVQGLAALLVSAPTAFDDETLDALLETGCRSFLNELKRSAEWAFF